MTEAQISGLWTLLYFVLIFGGILLIYFLVWTAIWHPIKKKDDHEKKLKEERKELQEIQVAKGVEWDKYKEQQNELDRLRKSYFQLKDTAAKEKEQIAKLKVDKENILSHLNELKKQNKANNKEKKEVVQKT